MRKIKFRAWDKKSKKMRQVTEIVFNTGFYMEKNDNSVKLIWVKGQDIIENKEIQMQREKDYILMQYTGLKDKNGVEIYEGDIVAERGHYCNSDKIIYQKIQWKENYSCWLRGEYQRLTPKNIKQYQIEVVGNIYDNPDLLKGE